jgi:hypothetical protein
VPGGGDSGLFAAEWLSFAYDRHCGYSHDMTSAILIATLLSSLLLLAGLLLRPARTN